MTEKWTSIMVGFEVKADLGAFKTHPKESYNDVVRKLIAYAKAHQAKEAPHHALPVETTPTPQ
jgi:hypothetical protein